MDTTSWKLIFLLLSILAKHWKPNEGIYVQCELCFNSYKVKLFKAAKFHSFTHMFFDYKEIV